MPYPSKNLHANETVKLDMHPHWWYFVEPAALLVLSVVAGIFLWSKNPSGWFGDALRWIVLALIIGGSIWLVVRYCKWITTSFVITTDRLIYRSGLISKHGIEIPLDRVNNVNFNQGIIERMLGAGDLLIESGGEDGQSRYSDIRHPDHVQNLINAQIQERVDRRSGVVAPAAASVDVAEQLERLEGMLQRGTLTQDEFDSQKRKLLGL